MAKSITKGPSRLALGWLVLWLGGVLVSLALSGNRTVPHDLPHALRAISLRHPLGCDAFGRDLLATVLHGSATSMFFAGVATATTVGLAIVLGVAIALSPPALAFAGERVLDSWLAFPSLLLALAWAAIRGPGWGTLIGSLLLGSVPVLTRLVVARSGELAREDFVVAARSLGAGTGRIAYRHLLPGVLSLVAVKLPNLFSGALMAEATLSFMGVGAPIGRDTWGSLLIQSKDYLFESPHIAFAVGTPLTLTILALNVLSDARFQKTSGRVS